MSLYSGNGKIMDKRQQIRVSLCVRWVCTEMQSTVKWLLNVDVVQMKRLHIRFSGSPDIRCSYLALCAYG